MPDRSRPSHTVPVELGSRRYDITIAQGLLTQAGRKIVESTRARRAFLITDTHTGPLFAPTVEASLTTAGLTHHRIQLPAGEQNKSFTNFEALLEKILSHAPDRHCTLIALGGGVIGDITGFAASVLLRGVPFVQIPTSLLAQVDSSVGGKTAINSRHGKNLIGSFYQPKAVLIDTDTLASLPDRELRAGLAEILKYGALGDAGFLSWLETNMPALLARDTAALTYAIATSCAMKASIVTQDETEQGQRALLNLGHTFGHALEAFFGYDDRLLHGEGVALGMVQAAHLSHHLGLLDESSVQRLANIIRAAGLPASMADLPQMPDHVSLLSAMTHDKKTVDGSLTFILMRALGQAFVARNVTPAAIRAALTASETPR